MTRLRCTKSITRLAVEYGTSGVSQLHAAGKLILASDLLLIDHYSLTRLLRIPECGNDSSFGKVKRGSGWPKAVYDNIVSLVD